VAMLVIALVAVFVIIIIIIIIILSSSFILLFLPCLTKLPNFPNSSGYVKALEVAQL